jgi:nucleoside-diphosphate-sugar epimerase
MIENILISGATGFVGTNVNAHFKGLGCATYTISRISDNSGNQFLWDKTDELINLDIDTYIHLAGKAHDLKNVSQPEDYFTVNVGLTQKFFNLFLVSKATTFIYFSSVKAVADSVSDILDEDVAPDPKTPYGQSKLKAEEFLLAQKLPADKRLFILRPCMIHGPGNKGNLNLLYKFVRIGIPYPLAAFKNKRSFLSIANLNYIIEQLVTNPKIQGGIYNIADDNALSTNEVIRVMAKVENRQPRLWHINPNLVNIIAKVGDKLHLPLNLERLKKLTENYVVSNQKLKAAMNVESLPVSTQEGLIETIKSFNYKSQI